jgi:hypothetical protein
MPMARRTPELTLGQIMHRTIDGGIGRNLPQEAPQAFAKAITNIAES